MKRIGMNDIKDILRQRHGLGLTRDRIAAATGVADKRDEHPSRLSGGQQQRVAIARALAARCARKSCCSTRRCPTTSALDPEVIGEVTNVIRQLVGAHNLTMLMVTHQMGFAREISDRVCFFYNGMIHRRAGTSGQTVRSAGAGANAPVSQGLRRPRRQLKPFRSSGSPARSMEAEPTRVHAQTSASRSRRTCSSSA